MKYFIGKIVGFIGGVIITVLGLWTYSTFVMLDAAVKHPEMATPFVKGMNKASK